MAKCFCHFNGYEVKDAKARKDISAINEKLPTIQSNATDAYSMSSAINGKLPAIQSNATDAYSMYKNANSAGSGLSYTPTIVSDITAPCRNGWFGYNSETQGLPDGFTEGVCEVSAYGDLSLYYAFQTLKDKAGYIAHRVKNELAGSWSEWEYDVAPMVAGEEYRTTERHNGKVVYTKLIECGNMPNKDYKYTECGVNALNIIDIKAYAYYAEGTGFMQIFPMHSLQTGSVTVVCWAEGTTIAIHTLYDESRATAKATIKYTKD